MRKFLLPASLAALLPLVACPGLSDPTTAFTAILSAYSAAVAAEAVYLNTGHPDAALVKQIETYRVAAHNVLAPIEAEIAAGNAPTSTELLAAQAAVGALTQYEGTNNIKTGA